MNPEQVINKLKDLEGWAAFGEEKSELAKELLQGSENEKMDVASMYLAAFSTDAGQRVLDHMIKNTLMIPVVSPNSTQFHAGMREGQNAMVRNILFLMSYAATGGNNVR